MPSACSIPRPSHQPVTGADGLPPSIEDQLLEALLESHLATPERAGAYGPGESSPPETTSSPPTRNPSPETRNPVSPTALARRFNLSLRLVLDFLSSPLTRSRLAAALEAAELEFNARAVQARHKALSTLESILDDPEADKVEKRRAASAILRPLSRSSGLHRANADLRKEQKPRPLRNVLPNIRPGDPPEHTLLALLSLLQDNDNPAIDHGRAQLQRYIASGSAASFKRSDKDLYLAGDTDKDLTNFNAAIVHPKLPDPPPPPVDPNDPYPELRYQKPDPVYPVTLFFDNHDARTIHFSLRKQTAFPFQNIWTISNIQREQQDSS